MMAQAHSPFCGCDACAPPVPPAKAVAGPGAGWRELSSAERATRENSARPILEAVAAEYGLTVAEVLERDRHRARTEARALVAFFAKRLTTLTFEEIGAVLGRHYSTVMSAVQRMDRELPKPGPLREAAERVLEHLEQGRRTV